MFVLSCVVPRRRGLSYVGTSGVLAAALRVEVDGAENLHWELDRRRVMRFAEPWIAERITPTDAMVELRSGPFEPSE